MTTHPAQYSAVLLVTTDGKLLFHQRDDKKVGFSFQAGQIGMYGGGVEDNETYEEAAIRELQEELNFSITLNDLELFTDYPKTKEIHGFDQACRIFLVKNVKVSELRSNPNEGQGYVALTPGQEVTDFHLTKMAREIFQEYSKRMF